MTDLSVRMSPRGCARPLDNQVLAPAKSDAIAARRMLQLIQMRWSYSTIPTMVALAATLAAVMVTLIASMITIFTAILISPSAIIVTSVRRNKATAQTNHHQACD